ncbi:MAG: FtsX-like permease family protein [Thermotogota bacterium]|nr:FtsX-like permease family protein [Thermotogota bacterium]
MVLEIILGILSGVIVLVLLLMARNRIIAAMSLRNIFRQPTNTLLVILGSLMGTALITGSFAMTDSFNKFIYAQIEGEYGEIDQIVYKTDASGRQTGTYFSLGEISPWLETLRQENLVDGVFPVIRIEAQVKSEKEDSQRTGLLQNYLKVSVMGVDWDAIPSFGTAHPVLVEPEETDGIPGVYLSKDLAFLLKVEPGDTLSFSTNVLQQLAFWSRTPSVKVAGILPEYSYLNYQGAGRGGMNGSLVLPEAQLRKLINLSSEYETNAVLISNRGDFTDGVRRTDAIVASYTESGLSPTFKLDTSKKELVDVADEGNFGLVFLGLSAFAILAGILLISNTFKMLSEERQIELATMRALGYKRSRVTLVMVFEGFFYSVLSSVIGVAVGMLITHFILGQFSGFIDNIASILPFELPIPVTQENITFGFYIKPISIFYSFILGLSIPLVVIFYTSSRNAKMNIVDSIRGLPPAWDQKAQKRFQFLWVLLAFVCFLVMIQGWRGRNELVFSIGVFSFSFFLALSLPFRDKRWPVTLACFWVIGLSMLFRPAYAMSELPNPWVVLVKGVAILLSCILLVIFNLKVFESVLKSLFSRSRLSKGVTKIAIAFPSKNRTRTGLTISMYTLVVFIVTLISIIPYSEEKVIRKSRDNFFIGNDLLIVRSPFGGNTAQNALSLNEIMALRPEVSTVATLRSAMVRNALTEESSAVSFSLYAFTKDFVLNDAVSWTVMPSLKNEIRSSEDLIAYLIDHPGTGIQSGYGYFEPGEEALLVGSTGFFSQGGFGDMQQMMTSRRSVAPTEQVPITIIGTINENPISMVQGVLSYEKHVPEVYLKNAQTTTFASVKGENAGEKSAAVKTLSDELLASGYLPLYADDIIKVISAMIDGIINILRSFLYFGMVVGIAGIAILMFRALYERKRIIGMLKAIGYTKSHIFQSFFIETSFIVLLGIVLGVIAGILTSQQFLTVLNFSELEIPLSIPWGLLLSVCAVFYAVSLAVTFIPSYMAARIPPAEALRFFE